MNPRMDSTISTPSQPFLSSSPSPTESLESGSGPAGTRRASSLEVAGLVKPARARTAAAPRGWAPRSPPRRQLRRLFGNGLGRLCVSLYDEADREIERIELDGP